MTTPDRDFDLLTEEVRRLRQRVENMLSRKGGYVDGLIRMSDGSDIHVNNDGQGLASRSINPNGLEIWTAHFRADETTGPGNGTLSGYSWQGAPFSTPDVLWDENDDWMRADFPSTPPRAFLSKSVNPIGDNLLARIAMTNLIDCGLRVDDGSDNNYYEVRIHHLTAGVLATDLRMRQRTGGGGVVTTDHVWNMQSTPTTLWLAATDAGSGNHYPSFRIVNERGGGFFLSIGSTVSWTPSRAGLVVDGSGTAYLDWFWIP